MKNKKQKKSPKKIHLHPSSGSINPATYAIASQKLSESIKSITAISPINFASLEEVMAIQTRTFQDIINSTQNIHEVLDNFTNPLQEAMKAINKIVEIPTFISYQEIIHKQSLIDVEIKSVEINPEKPSEIEIEAQTTETRNFTSFELVLAKDVSMKLSSIHDTVQYNKETLDYLTNALLKRDRIIQKDNETILDLLHFIKDNNSPIAKIKKLEYSNQTSILHIDNKTVKINSNNNQGKLCATLFKNKKSIKKLWDMDEIVEDWSESSDNEDLLSRAIYDAARQLDINIQLATNIQNFIIYTTKTVTVNPKYIE